MIGNRLRYEFGAFALGLLLGAVLGVTGVSLAPILIVVISVPLFVSLSALRATPPDSRRSAAGAGVLLGVGAVFMDGAGIRSSRAGRQKTFVAMPILLDCSHSRCSLWPAESWCPFSPSSERLKRGRRAVAR